MALNFKQIAQDNTVLSEVMKDRVKVDKKNGEYTMVDFDIVQGDKDPYAVIAISDTEFINGGFVLTKIVNGFVDACDGSITDAREEYAQSEPLRFRLEKSTTKNKNTIFKVEIL